MSSTSFTLISTQFSIYFGLLLYVFGMIGNAINLRLLFSTRSIASSLLLFVSSLFNLIALSTGLLLRVLANGFGADVTSTSIFWCRSRIFLTYTATFTSLSCICFASLDRFFVSSRSVTWRNRSKLTTAKITVLVAFLVFIAINIPYLIFYTIVEAKSATGNTTTKTCTLGSAGLVLYGNYFVRPVLLGFLPGLVLIITGLLTYRNVTSITGIQVRGTFQRSLTSMILLQTIAVVIPLIPFATMNAYQSATASVTKTSDRLALEKFLLDTSNIVFYASYASNFYVYLISASSYRRDFLRLFLFCCPRHRRNNHIGFEIRQQLEMNTGSMVKQVAHTAVQQTVIGI